MRKLLFRLFSIAYIILFVLYFQYRISSSLGKENLAWRAFVLVAEFLSSLSVLFIVFLRLREPWTEYAGQPDGIEMMMRLKLGEEYFSGDESEESFQVEEDGGAMNERTPLRQAFPNTARPEHELEMAELENNQENAVEETEFVEEYKQEESSPSASNLKLHDLGDGEIHSLLTPRARSDNSSKGKGYIIRVLIPCYKEGLSIIKPTVLNALKMRMKYPENLHVYLCDDGEDIQKREFIQKLRKTHSNVYYVIRPQEYKGHGKSGNLNYTLSQVIYPCMRRISRREVVSIFDADMIAMPDYVEKLIPYFRNDKRCVMAQSPQTFHNVPKKADYFDAHNMNFFQYTLPAYSVWNTTTCCGTNFLVSANALRVCGWFPTLSVTEDMYLAILLLSKNGRIMYHPENLVVGEAPQDLRQIFQQRSRWAKGTMQIFFKDNPLFKSGLNLTQRISFFNAAWAYITSAYMNPVFVLINAMGILFGLFPVRDLDFYTAMLFICYYGVFYTIIHFTPVPHKDFTSLWVVGKMGHFFSFMAFKAIFNVTKKMLMNKNIVFKVTQKTAVNEESEHSEEHENRNDANPKDDSDEILREEEEEEEALKKEAPEIPLRDSSHRDIVFHWIMCIFIVFTILYGWFDIFGGRGILPEFKDERNEIQKQGIRLFMSFWMIQFLIAYSLPLWYAYLPQNFNTQGKVLRLLSLLDVGVSILLIILTVLLFKVGLLSQLPDIDSITRQPPSEEAAWVNSISDQGGLGEYIFETALNERIPVIVINHRPDRQNILIRSEATISWQQYSSALRSIASIMVEKDYPGLVILEPGWMEEAMYLTENENDPNVIRPAAGQFVAVDNEKWYRCIVAFKEFASLVPDKSRVYVDVGSPYYHSVVGLDAIEKYNLTVGLKHKIRGLAMNTAGYYSSDVVRGLGDAWYRRFAKNGRIGFNYIEDTGRNGGTFSENSDKDIYECRFDPPFADVGRAPGWKGATSSPGLDGSFWSKRIGQADGRIYPYNSVERCLKNHPITCSIQCPVVPDNYLTNGDFAYPQSCMCD